MQYSVRSGDHERRGSRRKRWFARLSLVLVLVTVFSGGLTIGRIPQHSNGGGARPSGDFASQPDYQIVEDTWDVVRSQYVDIDNVNPDDIVYGASGGLVDGLGDTGHSRFLDPKQAKNFIDSIQGSRVGVGIQIGANGDQLIVDGVVDGGPADKAGVRRGDVMTRVNGDDVTGLTLDELDPYFDGIQGHKIDLEVYRPTTKETRTFHMVQTEIDVPTVAWSMLPDDVAMIRISEFDQGTGDDFRAAVQDATGAGATAILLDLRDNPGGLVDELINVASEFLPKGTTVYEEKDSKGKVTDYPTKDGGIALDTPLTVLVNRGSASAAEILAAGLRDNHRAEIIGQTTFGTGTVLIPTPLKDGSLVVIGSYLWMSPDGTVAWHVGVKPDDEVLLPYGVLSLQAEDGKTYDQQDIDTSQDDQVEAGLEVLTGGGEATPAATPAHPKAPAGDTSSAGASALSGRDGTPGPLALEFSQRGRVI